MSITMVPCTTIPSTVHPAATCHPLHINLLRLLARLPTNRISTRRINRCQTKIHSLIKPCPLSRTNHINLPQSLRKRISLTLRRHNILLPVLPLLRHNLLRHLNRPINRRPFRKPSRHRSRHHQAIVHTGRLHRLHKLPTGNRPRLSRPRRCLPSNSVSSTFGLHKVPTPGCSCRSRTRSQVSKCWCRCHREWLLGGCSLFVTN